MTRTAVLKAAPDSSERWLTPWLSQGGSEPQYFVVSEHAQETPQRRGRVEGTQEPPTERARGGAAAGLSYSSWKTQDAHFI